MSDKKALTSSGGHGKFHVGDEDDYGVPSGSGHQKSAFFSTWISRLGGSQPRRGSVGFNEQTDFPPNRFAEEENSNSLQDSQKMALNFGLSRKRNESFSENFGTTPGEDCDSYFLKNKFRYRIVFPSIICMYFLILSIQSTNVNFLKCIWRNL